MAKKLVVLTLLLALVSAAVVAEDSDGGIGFVFRGNLAPTLSIGNYFRGGALGGQALVDLYGIHLGVEAYAEYDFGFHVFDMPINLVLGLGRDFWILAGYTIPFGTPTLGKGEDAIEYSFGGLPNTYGLGYQLFRFEAEEAPMAIGLFSEITWTMVSMTNADNELEAGIGNLAGMFAGLKGYIGVNIELDI